MVSGTLWSSNLPFNAKVFWLKLRQTMDKGQVHASFVPFQWRTIHIGSLNAQLIISFGIWNVHINELKINYNMTFVNCNKVSNISTFHLPKLWYLRGINILLQVLIHRLHTSNIFSNHDFVAYSVFLWYIL